MSDTAGRIRLVGTAHVSPESVREVEGVIGAERPDVVAVELDADRYARLRGADPSIDPASVIRGGAVTRLLAYWLLSYVQSRLAERFGVEPGADMRAACDAADAVGAEIALVDRDIHVTIRRLWRAMSLRAKLRLLGAFALAAVGVGEAEELDVEELTETDVVTAMIEEFRAVAPGAAEALIDERDAYIARRLLRLREDGHHVVAVVGAGHADGIRSYLDAPATLPDADPAGDDGRRIPWGTVLGGLVSGAAIGALVLLALGGVDDRLLLTVIGWWVLLNGAFAFALARIAGARWRSAGVGGAVAWMTSINPLLAPGWFTGYLELSRLPVRASDVSRLNDLLAQTERPLRAVVGDMLDVPLFRLVVIVAATNIGSVIASALFFAVVVPWFGAEVGGVDGMGRLLLRGLDRGVGRLQGAIG